jgi:ribose 5-phosphate isomerase B
MESNLVAIASDHAGFEQKQQLVAWLKEQGFEVRDLGPASDERVDYPDYASAVAHAVASGAVASGTTASGAVASGAVVRGVLVCGTGIGMAIAANKVPGVRAANVIDPRFAVLAREHNDANVIALSGRFVDLATNKRILGDFLSTPFGKGRHAERVAKIAALE